MSNQAALNILFSRARVLADGGASLLTPAPIKTNVAVVQFAESSIKSLEGQLENSRHAFDYKQRQLAAVIAMALGFGIRAEEIQDVLDATK